MFDLYMFIKVIQKQEEMMEAGAERAAERIREDPDYEKTQKNIGNIENQVGELKEKTERAVDNMNHTVETTVKDLKGEITAVRTEMGSTRDDIGRALDRVEVMTEAVKERVNAIRVPTASEITQSIKIPDVEVPSAEELAEYLPSAEDIYNHARAKKGREAKTEADEFEEEITNIYHQDVESRQKEYDDIMDKLTGQGISAKTADAIAYRIANAHPQKKSTLTKRMTKMMKDRVPGGEFLSLML